MKKIGIISNLTKDPNGVITREITSKLINRGLHPLVLPETHKLIGVGIPVEESVIFIKSHLLISLGGDGTLLSLARRAAEYDIPVLGMNMGRLGFLTELEMSEADRGFDSLLRGEYSIERRMMLEVTLKGKDGGTMKFTALNDAAVAKASFARIIHLRAYINDELVNFYPADGLLVSTPTGSTAYSLSAGGPIISPEMECLLLTPICPHSLNVRPIVTDSGNYITIEVVDKNRDLLLTVDGQEGTELKEGDIITISKAAIYTSLVRIRQRNFFKVLRAKLTERYVENGDSTQREEST